MKITFLFSKNRRAAIISTHLIHFYLFCFTPNRESLLFFLIFSPSLLLSFSAAALCFFLLIASTSGHLIVNHHKGIIITISILISILWTEPNPTITILVGFIYNICSILYVLIIPNPSSAAFVLFRWSVKGDFLWWLVFCCLHKEGTLQPITVCVVYSKISDAFHFSFLGF